MHVGKLEKDEIFNRLNSLIPNMTIQELKRRIEEKQANSEIKLENDFKVVFDVYLPDKAFRKSEPGEPIYQVLTQKQGSCVKWPGLYEVCLNESVYLSHKPCKVKFLYAFVDNGDILFYSFKCDQSVACVF